jgi:RNA polymerase sigma factor (sigma-70 family)
VAVAARRGQDLTTTPMNKVIQHIRKIVRLQAAGERTDGQLLESFVRRRETAALEALVRRHGPMVWGVCRRILHSHHDAEDAFQATFLVLVRKAATVKPREMVGNWLYGVAHQTALKARATRAKRRTRERQVADMPEPAVKELDLWRDLLPVLDQELSRLPDKYRVAIVLCDLEGKTRKEAARQLGCPEGTLAARLTRGRVMLAKRLAAHGLAISGGALAGLLTQQAASAVVPTSVVVSTIKAVTLFAAGQAAAAGAISVKVAALTEGVLKTMLLTKLKVVMVLFVVASLSGTAGLIYQTQAAEQSKAQMATGKGDKEKPTAEKAEKAEKQDADAWFDPVLLKSAKDAVERARANLKQAERNLELAKEAQTKKKCDESLGYIKPERGPQTYRAFFGKTLGVMGEHFEQISYANQYDGRIEVSTVGPAKEPSAVIRQGVVNIRALDEGGFAVSVRIDVGTMKGTKWTPAGRDQELEGMILQQLNAQQDQKGSSQRSP